MLQGQVRLFVDSDYKGYNGLVRLPNNIKFKKYKLGPKLYERVSSLMIGPYTSVTLHYNDIGRFGIINTKLHNDTPNIRHIPWVGDRHNDKYQEITINRTRNLETGLRETFDNKLEYDFIDLTNITLLYLFGR